MLSHHFFGGRGWRPRLECHRGLDDFIHTFMGVPHLASSFFFSFLFSSLSSLCVNREITLNSSHQSDYHDRVLLISMNPCIVSRLVGVGIAPARDHVRKFSMRRLKCHVHPDSPIATVLMCAGCRVHTHLLPKTIMKLLSTGAP